MFELKLLTVDDHFLIAKVGLVVMPDFSIPQNGSWRDFATQVKIVTLKGKETEMKMRASLWHFNPLDPNVSTDKRWRVVLSFPEATKEQIPLRSQVFVSSSDFYRIMGLAV